MERVAVRFRDRAAARRAWRDEAGEALVRESIESIDHDAWVSLREMDGSVRHHRWGDWMPYGRIFTIGIDGVRRVLGVLGDRIDLAMRTPWDGHVRAGADIDVVGKTLPIWQATPSYPDDLIGALEATWPGWRIVTWASAGDQLRASGESAALMWGPDTERELDERFASLGGHRETGAEIMATAVRSLSLREGSA